VREALFSILADRVAGARVIDVYAGSGALGIEALSRGASHATFVEVAKPALDVLRTNIADLDLISLSAVVPLRLERSRSALSQFAPFDIALCDPPWDELPAAMRAISRVLLPALSPGALLIVEHPARRPPPAPEHLVATDERTWGDTGASFFCRSAAV
jgi:16S rRNA (guanine966-N2)-methyltransferase